MSGFGYHGRLLLCRHGEATGNLTHAFLGRRDDQLTELGRSQAERLAELVASETVNRVISSPLRRAQATAQAVCTRLGLPIELDDRLLEQDFGAWEGFGFEQARARYSADFAAWYADANNCPPTAGETLTAVADRVEALWRELPLSGGETHLLVGHGSCLQALLCRIFHIPTRAIWPFRLANGSLTEVQFTPGGPSMTRLGAH